MRTFSDLENSVPPGESNEDLLDQAWDDHTGESLDAKKVVEAGSLRWSMTTRCTCSKRCLMLNAGRGQARHPWKRDGLTSTKARDIEADW